MGLTWLDMAWVVASSSIDGMHSLLALDLAWLFRSMFRIDFSFKLPLFVEVDVRLLL